MLRQIWIVSALNFKSLKSRFWQSMVIVVGLGTTIGVLLSMMSMTQGMKQAYFNTGDPGRAIVVSQGADAEGQQVHRFGSVEVDPATRTVRRGPQTVELAPKEFDLLLCLLRARGSVVSRLRLLREVWGYSSAVVTRTVDTHIAELRRKLEENPSSPRHIITVRKSGYRLRG